MKKFPFTFALTISCCAGLAVSSSAQADDSSTVPMIKVQPQARQLIDGMLSAYEQLKSLSTTVELRETNPEAAWFNFRADVDFQKPNKGRIIKRNKQSTLTAISDGNRFFVTKSRDKKLYFESESLPYFPDAFYVIGADGPGLSDLLAGKNPLEGQLVKSAWAEKPRIVNGVPVDIVTIESVGPRSRSKTTYAIGRQDHLLRRVFTISTLLKEGTSTIEMETNLNVKANPALPASIFAFSPPPNANRVTSRQLDLWILDKLPAKYDIAG